MNETEFCSAVKHRDDLEIVEKNHLGALVKHLPSGSFYQLLWSGIAAHDWTTIVAILTGDREPTELKHFTRICGYYSQVENWNRSKVGELRGRHAGNYGIEGGG